MSRERHGEPLRIGGTAVNPGETADVFLKISETYTGSPVVLPVRVMRARRDGPSVFLTGALHGDEIIGVGIIRELMREPPELARGTLVCVPILNIFGFESHSRYLPDRRDLNRSFPGNQSGSLAFRLAHLVFTEIVSRCDYGVDLHSATARRVNFPHVRANLENPEVRRIAFAFGCELIVNGKGPRGSLRREAVESGCRTILLEAGEALKFGAGAVRLGVRGIRNILKELRMVEGELEMPAYQTTVERKVWVRAPAGGLLHFHVAPGDLVKKGAALATCESLFTSEARTISAPISGAVLGMTLLPAVKPGEPICHLARTSVPVEELRRRIRAAPRSLHRRTQRELAGGVVVSDKPAGR